MRLTTFYIVLLLTSTFLNAETRYVKAGSSNPVPPYTSWATASDSIGKCIAVANEGDTIQLSEGVFSEVIDLKRKMVLKGAGMYKTTIRAGNLARPTPQRFWLINLLDSNIVSDFKVVGNSNLLSALSAIKSPDSYSRFMEVENIIFDSLESAVGFFYGTIRNCKARVSIEFAFIENPAHNSTVVIENNEIVCNRFFSTYQSPFQPAGVSNIIVRKNKVVFTSDKVNIATHSFAPPGQTIEVYNNDFVVAGYVRSSVKLIPKYTFTNNTFHARILSAGAWNQLPLFDIQGVANFKNNIFSNIAYLFTNTGQQPASFSYNALWRIEPGFLMDSTNVSGYPVFTDINQVIYSGYWPIVDTSKILYNSKFQKQSPFIDKGDPLIFDVNGSRSDPGYYGGPYGESYAYLDTAPMPPFRGYLAEDTSRKAIRANWDRAFDPDVEKYQFYIDTTDYEGNFPSLYTGITNDTFALIPRERLIAGKLRLWIRSIDSIGNVSRWYNTAFLTITGIENEDQAIPKLNRITSIYPNPFNAEAKVEYVIGGRGSAVFRIYDVAGALLRTIDEGEQDKGSYNITLKMLNFASGVYFIRLDVKDAYTGKITQTQSKKIVMVK